MSITYTFTCDRCSNEECIDNGDEFMRVTDQKRYLHIFREDHQHSDFNHLCQNCIDALDENE